MSVADWIGTVGVTLLLIAFFLNLFSFMGNDSRGYHVLNAIGAGVACYASYRIGFVPFVVLEATWCLVALIALMRGRNTVTAD